jgi:hypothetical protein
MKGLPLAVAAAGVLALGASQSAAFLADPAASKSVSRILISVRLARHALLSRHAGLIRQLGPHVGHMKELRPEAGRMSICS